MEDVAREVPPFLRMALGRVYPEYARLAERHPNYWVIGWKFDTWQLVSGLRSSVYALPHGLGAENVQGKD
jgi:hypothetical protein